MNFLKTFLASLLAFIVANLLLGIFFVMILVGFTASLVESPKRIKTNSVLVLDLSNGLTDSPRNGQITYSALGGLNVNSSNSLLEAIKAIENATYDDNISGILIDCKPSSISLANIEELRSALLQFKEDSGKFIISYSEYYSQLGYYFVSVADKVIINPQGSIHWRGLATAVPFFKGALDKLGVEAEIIRHGTFKSAVEPYMLDKMSPENRLQTTRMLESVWGVILEDISRSRGITTERLNELASSLVLLDAADCVRFGLADGVMYQDQVNHLLYLLSGKTRNIDEAFAQVVWAGSTPVKPENIEVLEDAQDIFDNEISSSVIAQDVTQYDDPVLVTNTLTDANDYKEPNYIEFADYIYSVKSTRTSRSKNRIAIIYIDGEIVQGEAGIGYAASTTICEKLKRARKDDRVKAVVLRVNSPGGSSLASDIMWREIELLRAQKPVVVSMGATAASGGYYVSAPADIIIADRTTLTGSIGVFGLKFNIGGAMRDKLGITFDVAKTNPHSDIMSPLRSLDQQERDYIQKEVENVYNVFVDHVASGRNMTYEQVDNIGQGRVWTGVDAKNIGLIDGFGGLRHAISLAADRAGVSGDYREWEVVELEDNFAKFMRILSADVSYNAEALDQKAIQEYKELLKILERERIQMLMPYRFEIQ